MDDLFARRGSAAVCSGTGAGLPQFVGIPGDTLNGGMCANEFLWRMKLLGGCQCADTGTPL